jgi:adhesin transport system outer membrane protein
MRERLSKLNLSLLLPGLIAIVAICHLADPQTARADGHMVTIKDTVTTALEYSPRLKMMNANHKAVGHEVNRAEGGYYPRVDLSFGYGAEAHSDVFTRSPAEDNEHNFYDRLEAGLRVTQLLYDGKETTSLVGIEEAKYDSAQWRVMDNAEAISLDAVIAHLEVYRQRELVVLAEKNVQDHRNILDKLEKRQSGGAGSIADVSQTKARLARAIASLARVEGDLRTAEANYQMVVGKLAGDVEFFTVPAALVPNSLEEALQAPSIQNPKVIALQHNVDEAEERVNLSNSSNLPKINLELSSTYEDQVESSETYEQNNQAMMRLNWNLFNGGSDIADKKAAMARKLQVINQRDNQRDQVIEETRATWAELQAAKAEVVAFGDAITFNQKTLDAYVQQFEVGQRTLLDVLDAHNELFQSSGLLVTSRTNEVVAIERLLALGGKLNQSLQIDQQLYTAKVAEK